MEIIDPKPREQKENKPASARNVFLGAVFILVGVIWMLYNFDVISSHTFDMIFSWRTLLIIVGGFLMTQQKHAAGIIVASIGAVALALELMNIYIPAYMIWKVIFPAIFIIIGFVILFSKIIGDQSK